MSETLTTHIGAWLVILSLVGGIAAMWWWALLGMSPQVGMAVAVTVLITFTFGCFAALAESSNGVTAKRVLYVVTFAYLALRSIAIVEAHPFAALFLVGAPFAAGWASHALMNATDQWSRDVDNAAEWRAAYEADLYAARDRARGRYIEQYRPEGT